MHPGAPKTPPCATAKAQAARGWRACPAYAGGLGRLFNY
jgi:hypothetical protein